MIISNWYIQATISSGKSYTGNITLNSYFFLIYRAIYGKLEPVDHGVIIPIIRSRIMDLRLGLGLVLVSVGASLKIMGRCSKKKHKTTEQC